MLTDNSSLSLVTDSLRAVKFDADGKVLKHHGHEDDVDHKLETRAIHTMNLTTVQTWS